MATVEELVENNSKDELKAQAQEYELDDSGNKDDIAKRIVYFEATGGPPPEEEPEVESVEPDDTPDDDPVDAGGEESDEPQVLVRYTGKAIRYEQSGFSFGRNNPFKAVPESAADAIFESPSGEQFRVASPKEAKEFYS